MGEYRDGKWVPTFGDVQAGISDYAKGEKSPQSAIYDRDKRIVELKRQLAEYKHTPNAYSTMEQTMMEAEERSMELEKANEQLLKLRADAIEHHYNRGKQDGLREAAEAIRERMK
jgi:flagellar biosynthesis/type III secretory pathway protein FliH